MIINLKRSTRKDKKYMVIFPDGQTVHFGAKNNLDFILSGGDENKRKNYILRHSKLKEDWTKSGIRSPGFWSRWLLWEKPTLQKSIDFINKKFNVKINLI